MEFVAYIAGLNGYPDSDWGRSAWLGFKAKGTKVKVFEFIDEVPVNRLNIVVAGVKETYEYLANLDVYPRDTLNIPSELSEYAGRKIEYMTLGEFKKDTRLPIFVKPNGKNKEFDAGVISKESSRQGFFNEHPDSTPVMVSEVMDFVSEYRCYVIEGELVGIKHYRGNIRIFPDVNYIDKCIDEYKSAPAGYSLDVGVTSDGRTLIIECQDGWSLGNYGLEDDLYTKLICKRWMEFLKVGR
jgi:hypothetical protein